MSVDIRVVAVTDAFEIKPDMAGSDHEPGLIVVFDGRQCGFDVPDIGTPIDLMRPDGVTIRAAFTEMKEHGDGRTMFFPQLTRADAPIGTVIYWSATTDDVAHRDLAARS